MEKIKSTITDPYTLLTKFRRLGETDENGEITYKLDKPCLYITGAWKFRYVPDTERGSVMPKR